MPMKTVITLTLLSCFLMWGCDTKTKTIESCGDGFVDPGEDCDGSALNGTSCTSLGFYKTEGVLACNAMCKYNTADCGTARCGDEIIQRDQEDCEGSNLDGQTCVSLGYERGTLACNTTCSFDRSDCEGAGECGDGIIQVPEQCDGNQLDGETCVGLGYYAGSLQCGGDCQFDLDSCFGRCGDGIVDDEYQEDCDGLNLSGQDCMDVGFTSGTLSCSLTCAFDTSACIAACGDGVLNLEEECDGTNLGSGDCSSQGFVSGNLFCSGDCTYDTSGCTKNYQSPNIGTMIFVPAGTFQRDATATNLSQVSAFRMSQYEITRAQWTAVTGWADPSDPAFSSGAIDPIKQVTKYDAIAFCNKLSLLEGLTPVYAVSGVNFSTLTYAQIPATENPTWNAATANWVANGYRLPTEMEWMWAAMGADVGNPGAVNTTGYLKAFAGSTGTNAIGDYAVFGYESGETGATTTQRSNPVGSKLANELGFHDLSGNVWEWVWDWYDAYPTGTVTDYRGPASGTYRMTRGGAWSHDAATCAVAFRTYSSPTTRGGGHGFRIVRR